MSNPSNPNSQNPHHSHNQTQSIPIRNRALLSTPQPNNSTCSALSPPSYSNDTSSRCQGLDLLAMAALEVGGEAAVDLNCSKIESFCCNEGDKGVVGLKRRRQKALPLRFQDSVLQPWKRATRRSRNKKVEF